MSPRSFRNRSRKTYRRGRSAVSRVLSKKSIYGSRSARAQSNQIAALNRKLNYISKRDKPEIKTAVYQPMNKVFSSRLLDDVYVVYPQPLPEINTPSESGMIGDIVHMKSLYLNLYGEYYNNSQTGYHNSESAGCIVRIIALQRKIPTQPGSTLGITLDEIFTHAGSSGIGYTSLAFSPFKTGITERFRILMNRRYTLTTDKNQLCKNIRVPLGRFKDLRLFTYGNDNQWTNYIQFLILVTGLHGDSDFSEYVSMTFSTKLAYTDN